MNPIDRLLVRALAVIVLAAVASIASITFTALLIDGGVIGNQAGEDGVRTGDEVVSVLGQIASAGVGAMAGYFTARVVERRHHDEQAEE